MSKFNTKTRAPAKVTSGPIKVTARKTVTHEGADARTLDTKSELFTLGAVNLAGEQTFYEQAGERDTRYVNLVRDVTKSDPQWVANFLRWLRNDANMRSASLVGAAEYVRAGGPNGRQVVASVLQRADEPGELLAYWTSNYGRRLPAALKRGIADAAKNLYDEYSVQKYDSAGKAFRFADVIQLTHPSPDNVAQSELFKYALDRRYNGNAVPAESLQMLNNSRLLDWHLNTTITTQDVTPDMLRNAGWTWERLSSYGAFTKETWEAVIPTMGYMALLRNLRNFEQAGVSEAVMRTVRDRIADPEQVAKSRQLPFRFYSAYRAADNIATKAALETALGHSFKNVDLPGRTLVLIDVSGSMTWGKISKNSRITPAEVAALMGVATALGNDADVAVFGTSSAPYPVRRGGSVLNHINDISRKGSEVGHGTNIAQAIKAQYNGHDRVIVFTDMQSHDNGSVDAPVYVFDLQGYGRIPVLGKDVTIFGGWNDAFIKAIPMIESGRNANWPWE